MNISTPAVIDDEQDDDATAPARTRDADATRMLLLRAARRRFALDGYSSTTVRDIAADAGVNVALINRYFASKEGLFEACLSHVAVEFDRPASLTIEQVALSVVSRISSALDDEQMLQLLLLLRSSGDERADVIRRSTLRSFAEKIAKIAGWAPGDPGTEHLLLRAQIGIATALGMALLRASSGLEPLSSAGEDDLAGPLGDVFAALLPG
jgi:AcrR family transcriptional regulator